MTTQTLDGMTQLRYANYYGFSDVTPFEIVRVVSGKTLEIRQMKAERGQWSPEWVIGGFVGRIVNQRDQQWTIAPDETAPVERIRRNKKGEWRNARGIFHLDSAPVKFYDYNF